MLAVAVVVLFRRLSIEEGRQLGKRLSVEVGRDGHVLQGGAELTPNLGTHGLSELVTDHHLQSSGM